MDMRARLLELHKFWLPNQQQWPTEQDAKRWYTGGSEFDAQLRENFGSVAQAAIAGKGQELAADDRLAVALILALDQLPRNIFRGTAQAFAGDLQAQKLTFSLLGDNARIKRLWPAERMFALMPLMHAEQLAAQEESLRQFKKFNDGFPPEQAELAAGQIKFAQEHRDIIARFGKFPYRDKALGRATSAAEQQWIDNSGISYGQG